MQPSVYNVSLQGASYLLFLLASLQALAGYGDITFSQYPSWAERDVHIWTNMMRVDPAVFFGPGNDWGASCDLGDFQGDEATPKAPLYYDFDLNDAGRYHSLDMLENNWFDHDSSDGTSFPDRLSRFYTESGYIGENIAAGYSNGQSALLKGWMCSAGHRANIMNGDYNELGVGVAADYFTQDFAAGLITTFSPIAMGNHSPEDPVTTVDFIVDFQGGTPDMLEVVLNGQAHPVLLTFGTPAQGVYMTTVHLPPDAACHEYYFRWSKDDRSGAFPERESYLFGVGCFGPALSIDRQLDADGDDGAFDDTDEDLAGCLCASNSRVTKGYLGMLAVLCGLIWVNRRS